MKSLNKLLKKVPIKCLPRRLENKNKYPIIKYDPNDLNNLKNFDYDEEKYR